MSVIAAAIISSAVVGGISSNNASKKASKASGKATDGQLALGRESNAMTERMAKQAREDANRLFGQQETNTRAGVQAGLDLMGQTIPAQFQQINAGNNQAQQQLSGALPQINNAILGNAIDYSQFQPRQTPNVDMNMFNVSLPDYTFTDGSLSNPPPEPELSAQGEAAPVTNPSGFLGSRGSYGGRGISMFGGLSPYGGNNRRSIF